ncbi:stemmadenine O-acetyltransferase-like [Pistacia vera]|uniref:stemmadenine O-acetyltransferase-like n=1 Tax=Pistacia vera TaxID=55513 RepID=UPI001262BBCC|nr:stemmadenine O-acetyltransferase-like [Pistacia vera]
MKVDIVAKEIIKPSSPTPDNLRSFKLSLLDQLAPAVYGPMIFFYPNGDTTHHASIAEHSHHLKKSLADTLTRFFPLAGRIKDNFTIDCNDYGVGCVEARVNCLLSEILEHPDLEALNQFLPFELDSTESSTDSLILVQSTFFNCGGVAIGVGLSHKLTDGATYGTFLKGWSATALGVGDTVVPLFNASSLFPPRNLSTMTSMALNFSKEKCVLRRLVFAAPKIDALKAITASPGVQNPTRAEAVTALIWKCALNAARSNSRILRPSLLSQSVNLRRQIVPPLPENTIGNLGAHISAHKDESEIELQGLVREIRRGKQDFSKKYVKKLQDDAFKAITETFKEAVSMFKSRDIEFYKLTNMCNFPFYEIDFGWGKPTWVTIPGVTLKNLVKLMDSREGDGSIEALVILSEKDMTLFERDKDLLAYASLNPSILELNPMRPMTPLLTSSL